jgi:hypothetical protein
MINCSLNLYNNCHINASSDDNQFVGMKIVNGKPNVFFPLGYNLPKDDKSVRREILCLLNVLCHFSKREYDVLGAKDSLSVDSETFSASLCLEIIKDFLDRGGYYIEKENRYLNRTAGKIDWKRTIKRIKPVFNKDSTPAYLSYIVRQVSNSESNEITLIHKYCVRECFKTIGWLFTNYIPERVSIRYSKDHFLSVIQSRLFQLNNDKDKRLMFLLKLFVENSNLKNSSVFSSFGTNHFEYIWEGMIDKVFGIKEKYNYFPHTRWSFNVVTGSDRDNAPLEPDTIMFFRNKLYVLDAKYYKYGITGRSKDLPGSSSINKQITYGEFVHKLISMQGNKSEVYNAFLMPFNSSNNPFNTSSLFLNMGEATGTWKDNSFCYQKIQGILVDTRYLMHRSMRTDFKAIRSLAETIESFLAKTSVSP